MTIYVREYWKYLCWKILELSKESFVVSCCCIHSKECIKQQKLTVFTLKICYL